MLALKLMNAEIRNIIERKREELLQKQEKTKKFSKIAGEKIDRKFSIDLNDLTPTEIDFEMGKRASRIKEELDPRIYVNRKPGRSKVTKIFLIFPFFFSLIFKKPLYILKDFIFFNNALLVRLRMADKRIETLEEEVNVIKDENGTGI
ncbi:MAG: hypothetical protein ABFR75_08235 [Acidobacteriota bacterium]